MLTVGVTTFTNLENVPKNRPPFKYGVISCGADTWGGALGKGELVFSCDGRLRSGCPKHRTNYFRTKWAQYPVLDLLVVVESKMDKMHDAWMGDWGLTTRSRNILVFHDTSFLLSRQGKGYKAWGKSMRVKGYDTCTWCVEATKCGASVWSKYLVTFCTSNKNSSPLPPKLDNKGPLRACRNIIKTYGIPRKEYYSPSLMKPSSHPTQENYLGTLFGDPVYHWDGPCGGGRNRSWILVPEWGIRRIKQEEMMKLKGLEKSIYTNVSPSILLGSVEQHVWASISKVIAPYVMAKEPGPISSPKPVATSVSPHLADKTKHWTVPDLSINSVFYNNSIQKLQEVIQELDICAKKKPLILEEGKIILNSHRQNYGAGGPKHLVILWWEWPPIHWNELRIGASMNFMTKPTPGIIPNQELEGAELKVAIEFVNELINLKVLIPPPTLCIVVNTFPLLLVPKPGQEGNTAPLLMGKEVGRMMLVWPTPVTRKVLTIYSLIYI